IGLFVYSVIRLFVAPPPVFAANYVDDDYPGCIKDATENNGLCIGGNVSTVQTGAMSDLVRRILGPVRGVTITMDETDQNYIKRMAQGSAVGGMANYIAMMYQYPPADFGLWLADTGRTLGFLPQQVHAQGVGFSGLTPLLPLWKAFRNIAYLLLAIVMIVIGFMVMFRKKIDPKTVVTVQNALPRVVMTLLLITFSYAIVGLLIDLMYVMLTIGIAILGSTGMFKESIANVQSAYVSGGIGKLFLAVFAGVKSWDDLITALTPVSPAASLGNIPTTVMGMLTSGASIGDIIGFAISTSAAWLVAAAPAVIIALVLALILLYAYIRILFLLIGAYINVILALLVGPIQILFDAIPGTNGFSSWILNLISNLVVFPITALMLVLGSLLTSFTDTQLWTPPLLSGWSGQGQGIVGIIGLGIIMSIPSIAGSIKEALKAKPAIPAGPGAIVGPLGGAVGTLFQTGYQFSFI
ncbi:MAG: hypothetical protein AAB686_00265, partial [Patescibacteria group bacterium]